MLDTWSIYWFRGILVISDSLSFSLDPLSRSSEGDFILVSHAHGDHVAGLSSKRPKLASHLTFKLYEAQRGRKLVNVYPAYLPLQRFHLGHVDVEVHDSGHILGSSQFLFEHGSSSLVYTGDLNLVSTVITDAGRPIPCDELIIDATYGHPDIAFPDRTVIYGEIVDFVEHAIRLGRTPIFFAYSIGKAQELIALINRSLGFEVLVDERVAKANGVYESSGIVLNYLSLSSDEGKEAFAARALPMVVSDKRLLMGDSSDDLVKAIATGWSMLFPYKRYDAAFPLSSHADFGQLISYIKAAKPSKIYPFGYFAKYFSRWLNKELEVYSIPLTD